MVKVFLSSADRPPHIRRLRGRVAAIIDRVVDQSLMEAGSKLRFECYRWEEYSPQKAPDGGKVNDIFVGRVRESHLTIVLLHDEVRPGTAEELNAALEEEEVQLAVMRFSKAEENGDITTLKATLSEKVLFSDTRAINSDEAWVRLARPIIRKLVDEYERELRGSPDIREARGGE